MKFLAAIVLAAVSAFGLSACKQQTATEAAPVSTEATQPVAATETAATEAAAQATDAATQAVDAAAAAPVGGVPTSGSQK